MTEEKLKKFFPDTQVRRVIKDIINQEKTPPITSGVVYKLLRKSEDTTNIIHAAGEDCFATLKKIVKAHPTATHLLFYPKNIEKVGKKKYKQWIELGQQIGILDPDQDIANRGYLIDLKSKDLLVIRAYMALTFIRWVYEADQMVLNTLKLVNEAGRDFWASVLYLHKKLGSSVISQSLIPFKGPYYADPFSKEKTASFDLALVLQLYRLTHNPADVCKVTLRGELETSLASNESIRWHWFKSLSKITRSYLLEEPLVLLSGELFPLISGGFSGVEEKIETLNKESKNVKITICNFS